MPLGATYNGPITLSASYQAMNDEQTGKSNIEHTSPRFRDSRSATSSGRTTG
jgi:hypothetical protein